MNAIRSNEETTTITTNDKTVKYKQRYNVTNKDSLQRYQWKIRIIDGFIKRSYQKYKFQEVSFDDV
jgi:hypothetical protein